MPDHDPHDVLTMVHSTAMPLRVVTMMAAILIYPALLASFFWSGRIATQAPDASMRVLGWTGVAIFITLALALPAFAFAVGRSRGSRPPSRRDVATRETAHLAAMAPPLYTATGVWLLILGLPGWRALGLGALVWVLAWPVVLVWLWRGTDRRRSEPPFVPRRPPAALRVAHGIGAALLILAFIGPHLLNHVVGLWGYTADKAVMDVLRIWYRSGFVQPIVVVGLVFMMATGVALARPRIVKSADAFGTLQTMTGAYLAAFLFSHMSAVLILARWEHGTDTDWRYATGVPLGFFGEQGNVRLIPHYLWAVAALVAHAACGLRGVMLAHGTRRPIADRTAWSICAAGVVLSAVIMSALLGARLR